MLEVEGRQTINSESRQGKKRIEIHGACLGGVTQKQSLMSGDEYGTPFKPILQFAAPKKVRNGFILAHSHR